MSVARLEDIPGFSIDGVAAAAGDEVIAAFAVLAPGATLTEEELLSLCRGQLAPHQVPASIAFVDALPRHSVGKLLRHELRTLSRNAGGCRDGPWPCS